jgi:resuscitation-promoting factor RpfA
MTDRRRIVAVATVGLVLASLLAWTGPESADLHAAVADPQLWLERRGPDAAAIMLMGLLCWAMLVWVGFGLVLIVCAAVPGAAGRAADALATRLVPAALRQAITVALGVSVGTAATAGTAAADVTPPASPQATTPAVVTRHDADLRQWSSAPESPGVDWPLEPVPAEQPRSRDSPAASSDRRIHPPASAASDQERRQPAGASSAPAGAAASGSTPQPGASTDRVGTPTAPGPAVARVPPRPGRNADQSHRAGADPTAGPRSSMPERPPADFGSLRVRPGDCLWLIAAHWLGPGATTADVAREWPRWYALNRSVIGGDPDVIRPGQALVPPPAPVRRT